MPFKRKPSLHKELDKLLASSKRNLTRGAKIDHLMTNYRVVLLKIMNVHELLETAVMMSSEARNIREQLSDLKIELEALMKESVSKNKQDIQNVHALGNTLIKRLKILLRDVKKFRRDNGHERDLSDYLQRMVHDEVRLQRRISEQSDVLYDDSVIELKKAKSLFK